MTDLCTRVNTRHWIPRQFSVIIKFTVANCNGFLHLFSFRGKFPLKKSDTIAQRRFYFIHVTQCDRVRICSLAQEKEEKADNEHRGLSQPPDERAIPGGKIRKRRPSSQKLSNTILDQEEYENKIPSHCETDEEGKEEEEKGKKAHGTMHFWRATGACAGKNTTREAKRRPTRRTKGATNEGFEARATANESVHRAMET